MCKVASITFEAVFIEPEMTSYIPIRRSLTIEIPHKTRIRGLCRWLRFVLAWFVSGRRLMINLAGPGRASTIVCETMCKDAFITPIATNSAPEVTGHILEPEVEICWTMCLSAIVAVLTIAPQEILTCYVFHF